jgi:hypothetical protein
MKRGYTGIIGNEFVFVAAKNIEEAKEKFGTNSKGKDWKMDVSRNFKIIN